MSRRVALFVALTALSFGLVAGAGCTVDANLGTEGEVRPEAGRDVSQDGPDGTPEADAPTDGRDDAEIDGADTGLDAGCGVSYPQKGGWVSLEVRQMVVPQGNGGNIEPGRYVLSAFRSYLNGPQGTAEARETVEFTGSPSIGAYTRLSEVRSVTGDVGAHGPRGEQFSYTIQSAIFMRRRALCPARPLRDFDRFSATLTTVTVVDTEENTERVYQRLP